MKSEQAADLPHGSKNIVQLNRTNVDYFLLQWFTKYKIISRYCFVYIFIGTVSSIFQLSLIPVFSQLKLIQRCIILNPFILLYVVLSFEVKR